MSYDPAFMNTASCRSAITYIDGDAGILQHRGYPIEQLCEHSTYLEVAYLLINGTAAERDRARRLDRRDHDPHLRARELQGLHAGVPLRREPDGDAGRLGRGALDLLPGRQQDPRGARARDPDHPPARQDAHARRVRLPAQHGTAVCLPRQRPQLRRQLPRDDVQDDRAQIRARSAPGTCARRALHPARRPRTERLDERCAHASARRRSTRTRPSPRASPRSTGRSTAAPTRPRCGCSRGSRRWRTSPTSSRA